MYVFQYLRRNYVQNYNLTSILYKKLKHPIVYNLSNNLHSQFVNKNDNNEKQNKLDELIEKYDDRLLFNSVIDSQRLKLGFHRNRAAELKMIEEQKKLVTEVSKIEPLPYSLKYLNLSVENETENVNEEKESHDSVTHFPFESSDQILDNESEAELELTDELITPEKEVLMRKEYNYNELDVRNWLTDYENYDDAEFDEEFKWRSNYGTPDPRSSVSNVPCGGCGALLHCKDTAIPGYIPSEIYKNYKSRGGQHLQALICQRCHFLKNYNMALQVRVSAEDYPKTLSKIRENRNALIILMVDLLDFPCSIWPNIMKILGQQKPMVVVGNKVDLLPSDSRGYLEHIKRALANSIYNTSNLMRSNILDVLLISAKTGYGIEELITRLHSLWQYKGNVYLVGCTNVGKSTLFNALLQSDYCKVKAADLIQRATTSLWPGTTLNLLKFPILKPSGWRLYVRLQRIKSLNKLRVQEERLRKSQLKATRNLKYATLIGHIERTFSAEEPVEETKDIFSIKTSEHASGQVRVGINENDFDYKLSKWCYDTPGVVHPDQILNMLTTEELMLTLPKRLILPRTFRMKPNLTVFIAGLGRLDFIQGSDLIRITVFASDGLPITMCNTNEADQLYKELCGTELFQVPVGNEERLNKWPSLSAGDEIKLRGIAENNSCADIVLSNAGWIAVSIPRDETCVFKAWTPEKRGIFVRECLLPKAVALRGKKNRYGLDYRKSRIFVKK